MACCLTAPSQYMNNGGSLLIQPFGTKSSEILIEIHVFLFKKMHLNISSAKCRPFSLDQNVLTSCLKLDILTHIRFVSLTQRQSYDCPIASQVNPKDMGKISVHLTTTKHSMSNIHISWDILYTSMAVSRWMDLGPDLHWNNRSHQAYGHGYVWPPKCGYVYQGLALLTLS